MKIPVFSKIDPLVNKQFAGKTITQFYALSDFITKHYYFKSGKCKN